MGFEIQVLDTWEAIRKRPGMYIGDPTSPSIPIQLISEAVCESRAKHAQGKVQSLSIKLFSKATGSVSDRIQIVDDGPGWSVDMQRCGKRLAELLLTQLYGCKAAKDPEHKGLCNAGIVVLNALCSTFEFTTWTGGRTWTQRYEKGQPVTEFTDAGDCNGAHGIQLFFSLDETIVKHTLPTQADLLAFAEELRADGLRVDL